MAVNQKQISNNVASEEQLYDEFAELLYDIYTETLNADNNNENIEILETQKLE